MFPVSSALSLNPVEVKNWYQKWSFRFVLQVWAITFLLDTLDETVGAVYQNGIASISRENGQKEGRHCVGTDWSRRNAALMAIEYEATIWMFNRSGKTSSTKSVKLTSKAVAGWAARRNRIDLFLESDLDSRQAQWLWSLNTAGC